MVKDAKRLERFIDYAVEHGDAAACQDLGITAESLARYRREYARLDTSATTKHLLQKIRESYTPEELRAIAAGGRVTPGQPRVPNFTFEGECVSFAHMTDFHMGSIWYRPVWWRAAIEECKKEGVQFLALTGDITDGLSNRPGHIYELTHIGFSAQKAFAKSELGLWERPIYAIDGNHDRYSLKSAGAYLVKELCDEMPNAEFLGCDEGDLAVGGITIKLWHGEDTSSYATSYRVQKIIEAFTGGEKPHVLLCGHTHKQGYFFERHVHAFSGGCMSVQSRWMRSKRLAAHPGFWIIKLWTKKNSVNKVQCQWLPFYG